MSRLNVIIAPDKRLKQKAMKVEKFDENLKAFANDLVETMKAGDGCGIASIQVDDDKSFAYDSLIEGYRPQPRIIIVKIHDLIIAVNPEIIANTEEKACNPEGCLSIPNLRMDIERYTNISVKFQDLKGKEHIIECDGYESICFQHEIDHLNGILAPDRTPSMQQLLLWKKFDQINNMVKHRR